MPNKKQGLISQILIIVIALAVLGFYFKIDIIAFVKGPEAESVLQGLKNGVTVTWAYMKGAVAYVGGLFD